jgi:hypothetical protein
MLIRLQLPLACPSRNENGQCRWGILQRRQRSQLRGDEGAPHLTGGSIDYSECRENLMQTSRYGCVVFRLLARSPDDLADWKAALNALLRMKVKRYAGASFSEQVTPAAFLN